MINLIF